MRGASVSQPTAHSWKERTMLVLVMSKILAHIFLSKCAHVKATVFCAKLF